MFGLPINSSTNFLFVISAFTSRCRLFSLLPNGTAYFIALSLLQCNLVLSISLERSQVDG